MIRQPSLDGCLRWIGGRAATVVAALALSSSLLASIQGGSLAADPLDGRLGGRYASFLERFGEPTGYVANFGQLFAFPDTRYVAFQSNSPAEQYEQDDPALVVVASADRDPALPADALDPGDWTWDTAQTIAADLAPTDAVFSAADESTPGSRTMTCASDALLAAFGTVSLGECRVSFLLSSDETVSFLTLTLASGAQAGPDQGTPEARCAGVVAWAEGSAERLDTAQMLLDPLSTLSDDTAVAVPLLRGIAASLDDLADEQRSADAPTEIATANYYFIGALNDFSAAISLAADGLEQGDQAVVDKAVDELESADERAIRASAEVESAVLACNLTTATPESE